MNAEDENDLGRQWDRGIPSGLRNFGEKLKSAMSL